MRCFSDCLKGCTEDFRVMTADGDWIAEVLDCLALVACTPAFNAMLEILGHTATSPIHICKMLLPTEKGLSVGGSTGKRIAVTKRKGSGFTKIGVHGLLATATRPLCVHTAIQAAKLTRYFADTSRNVT